MKEYVLVLFGLLLAGIILEPDVFAHRDGCHSKHSCPSDSGSYECGDTGHCSRCLDNNYCKGGKPRSDYSFSQTKDAKPIKSVQPNAKSFECRGSGMCIKGTVKKIIDGDTLVIDNYTVRLSLANTPEKNQYGFREATSFTKNLCAVESLAIVDQDDGQPFDKYNRMVGKVICSGKTLNSDLLYNGHASILTKYCKKSEFSSEPWAKRFGC
jgi:endonuclease YncB( thermonuclease family)